MAYNVHSDTPSNPPRKNKEKRKKAQTQKANLRQQKTDHLAILTWVLVPPPRYPSHAFYIIQYPGKDHSIPRQRSFYTQANIFLHPGKYHFYPGKDHTTVAYWRGSTSFKYLHILVLSKPMYCTVATYNVLDPGDLLYLLHKPVQQDQ